MIELNEESFDSETIRIKTHELINFVAVLKMGEFYSMQIDILMQLPPRSHVSIDPTDEEDARWREEYRITHFQKVSNVRNEVLRLIIEMLRYQSWKFEHG